MDEIDVDTMSIKAMKDFIENHGMSHADCVEKSDLRAKCREALARRATPPTGATPPTDPVPEPEWRTKQREYEAKKARAKELRLRLTCTICGEKAKLNCPCGTTQYCSTTCQRVDWRDRGHRKACKKIRSERAAEAARAEAPTPPPSLPVYGPAPRSHADEVRARIAAEHEAARLRREANPENPMSERLGSRCPICLEDFDVNEDLQCRACCCRSICRSCENKIGSGACPLCRSPVAESAAEALARIRRHVDKEIPEAIHMLGALYERGDLGLVKSMKKAANSVQRGSGTCVSRDLDSRKSNAYFLVGREALQARCGARQFARDDESRPAVLSWRRCQAGPAESHEAVSCRSGQLGRTCRKGAIQPRACSA